MKVNPVLKLLLVYGHLHATCIALGTLLQADHKLWRWRKELLDPAQREQLTEIQTIVSLALLCLWGSGLLLVLLGYREEGVDYLLNQKLWAKASVATLLTLNGMLLHKIGFPLLHRAPFVSLSSSARTQLGLLGALSMSSWLFAAFLGVARPWNHAMPYLHMMGTFAALLLVACAVAIVVVRAAGTEQGDATAEAC
jgi:hypothetical protein